MVARRRLRALTRRFCGLSPKQPPRMTLNSLRGFGLPLKAGGLRGARGGKELAEMSRGHFGAIDQERREPDLVGRPLPRLLVRAHPEQAARDQHHARVVRGGAELVVALVVLA